MTLEPIAKDQSSVLDNLVELYAHDFSEHVPLDLKPDGRFGVSLGDGWWTRDDHFPFFVRWDGKLSGFALVRRGSRITNAADVMDVAEFFVVRGARGRRVGTQAAHALFEAFPGQWEVRVRRTNGLALKFWSRAMQSWLAQPVTRAPFSSEGVEWDVLSGSLTRQLVGLETPPVGRSDGRVQETNRPARAGRGAIRHDGACASGRGKARRFVSPRAARDWHWRCSVPSKRNENHALSKEDAMMTHFRSTPRAQADLPITVFADGYEFACRTVDLSTHGMRVAALGGLAHHAARPFYLVEFPLFAGSAVALARPAWWQDGEAAFRIVAMADCDRLSLAEQMDASMKSGLALFG